VLLSIRKASATLFVTAMLGFGTVGVAAAQNNSQQNGLVNVSVGDVSILDDANIGVAASVAATICGVNVGPVVLLAQRVDATSVTRTVCTTDAGPVRISQA
jgi:hypothetical protein